MKKSVATLLLDIGAVNFNPKKPFVYTSGVKSPIYCDIRLVMSYPKEREVIMNLMNDMIENEIGWGNVELLSGTATAGIPFASFLAHEQRRPMIYVRSSRKKHGLGNQIEGRMNEKDKVLIVEDIVSSGKSSLGNVDSVRNAGGKVEGVVAVTSYEIDVAKSSFEKKGLKLHYLSPMSEVVEVAVDKKILTKSEKDVVLDWLKDPEGWAERMGV